MAEEIKIDFDDTYMNVIKFGHGAKNMVMISGISLCGLEGQGDAIDKACKIFCADYTVYLFDRKKVLPKNYLVDNMAEDIFAALQKLNVQKAYFFGVSQGGMIALYLAINHKNLVKKLALCSTSCCKNDFDNSIFYEWINFAKNKDVISLNRSFYKNVYSKSFLEKNKNILQKLEKIGTKEDLERFSILAKACLKFDVYDDLSKIKCDTFVLGDKNDKIFSTDRFYEIAKKLNSKIILYDKYSHAVYDEAEDLKMRVKDFFDKNWDFLQDNLIKAKTQLTFS